MSERDIPVNQQVHMGNFHVTLLESGELLVNVWPANALRVHRSSFKDMRAIQISRVYPKRRRALTEKQERT